MGQRDEDFTAVLDRLRGVREELGRTSSPERVAALRDQAQELLTRGRTLLGRHLDPPVAVPPAAVPPAGAAVAPAAGAAAEPDQDAAGSRGTAVDASSEADGRTEVLRLSPP